MTLDNIPRFNLYANSNLVEQPFGALVYYTDVMAVVEKAKVQAFEGGKLEGQRMERMERLHNALFEQGGAFYRPDDE